MSAVVTGTGGVVLADTEATCDPGAYLRVRKSRKFMGVQDDLAVVAAGRALASAGLGAGLGERVGLYLAVGYIPFQRSDIDPVLAASMGPDEGSGPRFSLRRFSEEGFLRAHPLLTFRCLPNMPAYHVSANFDLQGPYLVTYPGAAELYGALDEALFAIAEGRVDIALVGGVAHQRNFLVQHHFQRIDAPVGPQLLRDAAAFVVLEGEVHAEKRGATVRGRLVSRSVEYTPFDPTSVSPPHEESVTVNGEPSVVDGETGPASLPIAIGEAWSRTRGARIAHTLHSRGGITARSAWEGVA